MPPARRGAPAPPARQSPPSARGAWKRVANPSFFSRVSVVVPPPPRPFRRQGSVLLADAGACAVLASVPQAVMLADARAPAVLAGPPLPPMRAAPALHAPAAFAALRALLPHSLHQKHLQGLHLPA